LFRKACFLEKHRGAQLLCTLSGRGTATVHAAKGMR
jgi:hypothetical protein